MVCEPGIHPPVPFCEPGSLPPNRAEDPGPAQTDTHLRQCCQIGPEFPTQSSNPGCSALQPGLPDWVRNLGQSGNTDLSYASQTTQRSPTAITAQLWSDGKRSVVEIGGTGKAESEKTEGDRCTEQHKQRSYAFPSLDFTQSAHFRFCVIALTHMVNFTSRNEH